MTPHNTLTSLLKELRDEVRLLDGKFDAHLHMFHEDRQSIRDLRSAVDHIEKLLTRGNGQKPILARLEVNTVEIDSLKDDFSSLKTDMRATRAKLDALLGTEHAAEASRSKAKWIAVAKVAGIAALVMPGIIAWLRA
jgi:chromosome segregation ATPase